MGDADPIAAALTGPPHPAQPRRPAASAARESSVDIARDGDDFLFTWPAYGIGVAVAHLREVGDGLHAELTVQSEIAPGPLHWGRLNLASTSAREGLVGKLGKVAPEAPWRAMLERVCRETAERFRAGEPITVLRPARAAGERYLLERLLPRGETTVLFGDGGAGKSLLALAITVAVATGTSLPCGLRPAERASVLYLDWESTPAVHADRLHGLLAGLGLSEAPGLYYRPMARALADDATTLRAELSRRRVGLVVMDSFGPACGAEPEGADSAIRLMNALRSFAPATRLVIAHVSKLHAEQRTGTSRPFGSVYVQNLARSVWEIRRPEADDAADGTVVSLGLFHRKVNQGRRFPPLGLQVAFDDTAIRLRAQDLTEEPELAARASLSFRLLQALRDGERTAEELAERAGAPDNQIRARLSSLKRAGKVVQLDETRDRKGIWGLRHEG